MRWRVVQVEMCFFDALAMVSLRITQPKQALFQIVILLVPEGKGNVLQAMRVRYTRNAILAPSIGPGPCLIVREMAPGIAVL